MSSGKGIHSVTLGIFDAAFEKGGERPSLHQKRDEFIVDIRREERMSLINQKKFYSHSSGNDPAPFEESILSYLEGRPESSTLIPHILKMLETNPDTSKISTYINMIEKGDLLQKHTGIIMLRKCLSIQQNTPIQEIIDANAVPLLIMLINDDTNPHIQIEATWCVTNIATGTTLQINSLVEKGAIPLYIKLLKKPIFELVEQAVWGIGNIGADCIAFRNQLIENSAMSALVELYMKAKVHRPKIKDQIIWSASNLCRLKPPPTLSKVYQGIPMFIDSLLEATKINVITDCCWGLSQTCRSETINLFGESERAIKKIIELVHNPQLVIVHPCLRIIGVFTNGSDDVCQVRYVHIRKLLITVVWRRLSFC